MAFNIMYGKDAGGEKPQLDMGQSELNPVRAGWTRRNVSSSSSPRCVNLSLLTDNQAEVGFCSWFNRLPKAPEGTIRLFERPVRPLIPAR